MVQARLVAPLKGAQPWPRFLKVSLAGLPLKKDRKQMNRGKLLDGALFVKGVTKFKDFGEII